jgi:hypothetical protein
MGHVVQPYKVHRPTCLEGVVAHSCIDKLRTLYDKRIVVFKLLFIAAVDKKVKDRMHLNLDRILDIH